MANAAKLEFSRVRLAVLGTLAAVGFAALGVGCAGSQQSDDDEIAIPLKDTTAKPKATSATQSAATSDSGTAQLNDDQKEQIKIALRRGTEKIKSCNQVTGSNVSGEGEVQVVIDGKAGKVVDAIVGAPFAGSPIEACIKRAFVGEYALTFEGTLNVPYPIKIEAPAAPEPDKKDTKKK